jgi:shikimate dehydrogenase
MPKFGLIGKSLSHSFSQKYFSKKFTELGLSDHSYENFEIPNINDILDVIKSNPDLKGLNVTIPYKTEVIPLLDELSEAAEKIGAVNTIEIQRKGEENRLIGHNTDVIGFKESIRPVLKGFQHKALILGTGGASKAVDYVFSNLGLDVLFVSRNPSKSNEVTYSDLNEIALQQFLVVANTSPLGTYPNINECPDIPYQFLGERHLLLDLVYNPEESLFMKKGKEQGASVRNGYAMLVGQAEAAWGIWNNS